MLGRLLAGDLVEAIASDLGLVPTQVTGVEGSMTMGR